MKFVSKAVLPYQAKGYGFGEEAAMFVLMVAAIIQIACAFSASSCLLTSDNRAAVVQHR